MNAVSIEKVEAYMNTHIESPGLFWIAGGYVCAVLASAVCAALIMTFTANGGGMFLSWLAIGGFYIALGGLPGFVVTMLLARRWGWQAWLPFTLAGAANALVAWVLVSMLTGMSMEYQGELLFASVRAGAAGGVVYWWFAYHGLAQART